jgi:hypothetical protein
MEGYTEDGRFREVENFQISWSILVIKNHCHALRPPLLVPEKCGLPRPNTKGRSPEIRIWLGAQSGNAHVGWGRSPGRRLLAGGTNFSNLVQEHPETTSNLHT